MRLALFQSSGGLANFCVETSFKAASASSRGALPTTVAPMARPSLLMEKAIVTLPVITSVKILSLLISVLDRLAMVFYYDTY